MSKLPYFHRWACALCGRTEPSTMTLCPYCGSLARILTRGRGKPRRLMTEVELSARTVSHTVAGQEDTDMNAAELIVSRRDLGRLDVLLGGGPSGQANKVKAFLLDELIRANVVEDSDLPKNVVAMNSTVEFRDDDTGRILIATLVYPHEVDDHEHAVSVLTPVGAALIGLSEGQSIGYETPDSRLKTLTVLRILSSSLLQGATAGNVRRSNQARRRNAAEVGLSSHIGPRSRML